MVYFLILPENLFMKITYQMRNRNTVILIMKHSLFVCLLVLLRPHVIQAQDLGLKITPSQFSIGEKTYSGYSTNFQYQYSQIKKEWWRYIKRKASFENHKTHYVITFLSDKGESNTNLSFVSVTEDNEDHTTIKTALANQKINQEHQSDAKSLLLDFKLGFYTTVVQKKINKSEKAAFKISQNIDLYKKRIAAARTKKEKGKGNGVAISKSISEYKIKQDSSEAKLQAIQLKITQNKALLAKIK